jgi:hypothetical protein
MYITLVSAINKVKYDLINMHETKHNTQTTQLAENIRYIESSILLGLANMVDGNPTLDRLKKNTV